VLAAIYKQCEVESHILGRAGDCSTLARSAEVRHVNHFSVAAESAAARLSLRQRGVDFDVSLAMAGPGKNRPGHG
jgi:hypothetical protein